jgi:Yip1-like protein
MTPFPERLLRAALLQADLYEEVEADAGANRQAFVVVVLSGAAVGIGGIANSGAQGIFWQALVAVIGWWIWAYATYFIGTKLLPTAETEADPGQLLRTIGFSGAPGILRIAMVVPVLAFPVFVVGTLWELFAMVIAVRQALDYTSTLRAIAVCAIGFPFYALALITSVLFLGPWPV